MASRLVRAAHGASRVARLAAAAAARHYEEGASSRAASLAASRVARSARAAAASAAASRRRRITELSKPPDNSHRLSFRYNTDPPDDGKCVTEEDLESDEDVWALFERYCKSYKRKYDDAEMVRRFHIFKFNAKTTYCWNNYLHKDVKELARAKKDRDLGLPVDSWYLQKELGEFDDGVTHLPINLPYTPRKKKLGLDVIYSNTINLNRYIYRFVALEYVIFNTRLVFYKTEGVSAAAVSVLHPSTC
uniref:Cathepsin propeptide inhibitor domain-containing protein n=1 Tax=Oryza nivara TaxID=4536 RepID=A0A0E0JCR9_ORYNI